MPVETGEIGVGAGRVMRPRGSVVYGVPRPPYPSRLALAARGLPKLLLQRGDHEAHHRLVSLHAVQLELAVQGFWNPRRKLDLGLILRLRHSSSLLGS